jgi:hypothetical protein
MIELHPEIVEKDGKKQFVILPYEEFAAIQQVLAEPKTWPNCAQQKRKRPTLPACP